MSKIAKIMSAWQASSQDAGTIAGILAGLVKAASEKAGDLVFIKEMNLVWNQFVFEIGHPELSLAFLQALKVAMPDDRFVQMDKFIHVDATSMYKLWIRTDMTTEAASILCSQLISTTNLYLNPYSDTNVEIIAQVDKVWRQFVTLIDKRAMDDYFSILVSEKKEAVYAKWQ